ncbi:MAG: DUF6298 domain-containing protein [Verrucomicrobiota bacterium JB022]|nr:DUF6298 domain-containing protein [Verrucomicrobiota bacterium JB022]
MNRTLAIFASLAAAVSLTAKQVDEVIHMAPEGHLTYDADEQGNRVPDFSHAGYQGGGVPLPQVETVYVIEPQEGDDGARIQAALDALAQREPQKSGLRGAVQLANGEFQVSGQLRIEASGIVLRGSGDTTIVAAGDDRRTLITAIGGKDRQLQGEAVQIVDDYVPVGSYRVTLPAGTGLQVGDRVVLTRPSTKAWIEAVEMHEPPARLPYQWRPGEWDMWWDRTVVQIEGNTATFDAPITTALEQRFGGATVQRYTWPTRLENVGVEHLNLVSEFDASNPHDEEHAWIAIELDNVENAWVAGISARHFVSSLVEIGFGARAITVQDCVSYDPVSELAGYRRLTYHTSGQQTLFLRCEAHEGIHDFTAGYLNTGPNAFVDSTAHHAEGFSGSVGSWASGVLFENVIVDGNALRLSNLGIWNQGVGWALANSMAWRSRASVMDISSPPTATNWGLGVWGQFEGNGVWMSTSEVTANPMSLYRAQLNDRIGKAALHALRPLPVYPVPARFETAPAPQPEAPIATPGMQLNDQGWLTVDGQLLTGREQGLQWWRGSLVPQRAKKISQPSITRFAPGRTGLGLTDDLSAVAAQMQERGLVVARHHYGLWYDRRRDDHEMTRRINAEVWPPFYELPWARTGTGESWNRISQYDLTKFNPWYFRRLREFAQEAQRHELVLISEMYFQHNLIESGAHWVDFPWREVNSVQETGWPEPPPYDGDTLVSAPRFYDTSIPEIAEWHRLYIRKCLDNLADQPNVIHTVSAEYTGPLHFVEFWLDVIAEWEAETGKHPLIALSTPKDVQDAILEDPKRSPLIDLVDFTYWFVDRNGDLFAPDGGQNLAPRQHLRQWDGSRADGKSIARMVADYRARYPHLGIITGHGEYEGWSFVAAGGSLAPLPRQTSPELLASLAMMKPLKAEKVAWTLSEGQNAFFYYTTGDEPAVIDLRNASGNFTVHFMDLQTGQPKSETEQVKGGKLYKPRSNGPAAFWITR